MHTGAQGPGEGELKIVDWIQTHLPPSISLSDKIINDIKINTVKNDDIRDPEIRAFDADLNSAIIDLNSTSINIDGILNFNSNEIKSKKGKKYEKFEQKFKSSIHNNDSIMICGSDSDILLQVLFIGYLFIIIDIFLAGLYGNIWCRLFNTLICNLYK
jgi:hypothetical protein